jgi:hypothetical protein
VGSLEGLEAVGSFEGGGRGHRNLVEPNLSYRSTTLGET